MKTKSIKKDRVNVITMGCSKNLVDSENLITQLNGNGIDAEHEGFTDESNIIVINTCGFIDTAKQESIDTILDYANEKKKGNIDKLYVTGCLSERYKEDLQNEIPEVDAFFGTLELPALLAKFNANYKHDLIGERAISTPPHYAYLKIAEGCSRNCSFCAIPLMRGNHVSRTIESLVDEARNLAKRGIKELMLISQELTYYGLDIYKERALPKLLRELCKVEGIEWIRLHYAYPSKFPREVLEVMRDEKKICSYLDIPLQHASNKVLKSMKRQITLEETEELMNYARETVPDIAIRTTFLVGSPGETEEDMQELYDFVERQAFDRVGVFQYSHEEGTSAGNLVDDVSATQKQERASRVMEIQQDISLLKNQNLIGKTLKVLFDRKEGEYFVGRTEYDSPDVDNEVLVKAVDNYIRIGDFAMIRIVDATDYDLIGELANHIK